MSMIVSKARGSVQESIMCPSSVTSSLNEFMCVPSSFAQLPIAESELSETCAAELKKCVLSSVNWLYVKRPAGYLPSGLEMSALYLDRKSTRLNSSHAN